MALALHWQDHFTGPGLGPHWIGGRWSPSGELTLQVAQGLRWTFASGKDYASAGVVTRDALPGDFEAELHFEVFNPAQGTTFELAAIEGSPPGGSAAQADPFAAIDRIFDVHGAKPFVCSEFDEGDGWRMACHRNGRETTWRNDGSWTVDDRPGRSGNEYRKSAWGPFQGRTAGGLRLRREDGSRWYCEGRLGDDGRWLPTGERADGPLQGPVHLRIAAKHWRKSGLTQAPSNTVIVNRFILRT